MKKKVIRINESDIENLVKKIIKEEQLDEVGGYDSIELGDQHSKKTMETLLETFTNISNSFTNLNKLRFDILDDELFKETATLLKDIQPILNRYGDAWTSAEKRRIQKK
jgi:hypothetical protein